jgi:hypothetical protein
VSLHLDLDPTLQEHFRNCGDKLILLARLEDLKTWAPFLKEGYYEKLLRAAYRTPVHSDYPPQTL